MTKKIGILAGMGPRSTSPFLEQVLDQCQTLAQAKVDMDYPHMMIYSLPTPFYLDRELDHGAMEKAISHGARDLENCGVDFIAMPCNTAHLYFEAVAKQLKVPLLNQIQETVERVGEGARQVAVLGTRPTLQSKLYQRGLEARGLSVREEPQWLESTLEIISLIKAGGITPKVLGHWNNLVQEIGDAGVDTLVVACTDLTPLATEASQLKVVDSSLALAQATVLRWVQGGQGPGTRAKIR